MSAVADRIRAIIENTLGLDPVEGEFATARLEDDLGADSADVIEIIMDCEAEFGIEISDAEAEDVETAADLVALVEKHFAVLPVRP